jgi:hypothetical protein
VLTESRFQDTARTMRLPFVWFYGVPFGAGLSDRHPIMPRSDRERHTFSHITLLVAGGYVAALFWQYYVRIR